MYMLKHAYRLVCVCVCWYARVCKCNPLCVWWSKSLSLNMELMILGKLFSQWDGEIFLFPSLRAELIGTDSHSRLLHGDRASELRSWCLHSKYFIHWAISPAPKTSFLVRCIQLVSMFHLLTLVPRKGNFVQNTCAYFFEEQFTTYPCVHNQHYTVMPINVQELNFTKFCKIVLCYWSPSFLRLFTVTNPL